MSLLQTIRSRIAPRPREARHAAGRDTALQAPTWHYVAAAVAILCNIAAASALQFFPYGDSPNHLARYTLIAASWRHAAPAWVTFNWAPTSYIAVDVMGAALVSVLGPAVANRLLTALYLAVLPLGMLALLRAVNPRSIAWSIVASLLAFNWCFLTGFYSYSLGVGLSLVWLAWWWPRRNDSSPVTRIVGMAAIVALYLVHMSAAAVALTAVAVACVEPVMSAPHDRAQWGRMIPRAVTTMLYASGPVLLNVLMRLRDARLVHPADTPVFRDPADKLRHALTPFASFSHAQTVLLLAMYAAALVIRLRACRPRFAQLKWPLITVALLGVYAVFPVAFLGAWDVDVRFLLPAYLLVFVIPGRRGSEPPRAAVVGALVAFAVVHAAVIWWYGRAIDRTTREIVRLLPRESVNTLVLTSEEDTWFRIDPFTHVGEWATVRDPGSRVNGLFAGGPGGAHLDHFLVRRWLYDPGIHWARHGFGPLDWRRVDADYQFVIVTGHAPTALARVEAGAVPVSTDSAAELFRVVRTGRLSARPGGAIASSREWRAGYPLNEQRLPPNHRRKPLNRARRSSPTSIGMAGFEPATP